MKKFKNSRLSTDSRKLQTLALKQIDCSTKIKIIYRYVMSIELAGGEDKFYFDSFIQIEIPFLKVSQS